MPSRELTYPFIKHHEPAPDNKRIEYSDEIVDGLTLRITASGTKTFSYRYRINGRLKRYTIGKFPGVGLSEARSICKDLIRDVSINEDPQRKKMVAREELTVKELCEVFKEKHLPKLKETTQVDYKNRIDTVIVPHLGSIMAKDLHAHDVLDLLEYLAYEKESPIQSNRVRAILSSIYSTGQNLRYVESNPALSVKPLGKETRRTRYYSNEELRSLWVLINQMDQPVRSLFKILLITGQRLGETRMMEWSQIKNFVWIIPKENTKAKRENKVPLPPLAMKVLDEMRPITGGSKYVFESPLIKDQPISWVQWHARSIREHKDGIKDFRIHDIRRTVATNLAKLHVDRTVIGKILNHKQLAGDNHVTAVYDTHDYLPEKTRAINMWSRHLLKVVTEQTGEQQQHANILSIRG